MSGALAEEQRLLIEPSRLAPRLPAGDFQAPKVAWDRIGAAAAEHHVGPLYRNLARLVPEPYFMARARRRRAVSDHRSFLRPVGRRLLRLCS